MSRRLATIVEAAEYASVNPRTMRRYISAGIVTGYRLGRLSIRIDLDELDAALRPIPAVQRNAD